MSLVSPLQKLAGFQEEIQFEVLRRLHQTPQVSQRALAKDMGVGLGTIQQEKPEDFVIATGVQYSVRDFVNAAAKELGMQIRWEGKGVDEKGYDSNNKVIVAVDQRYFRPTEVETLLGDPSKAKQKLGWTPKISFNELVAEMVNEDLKSAERDELIKKHGYKAMDYHE